MLHQEIVLIRLVSSLFGGWTLLDYSEKDVHVWFTLKFTSRATNCNSVLLPSAGTRTEDDMVTM